MHYTKNPGVCSLFVLFPDRCGSQMLLGGMRGVQSETHGIWLKINVKNQMIRSYYVWLESGIHPPPRVRTGGGGIL